VGEPVALVLGLDEALGLHLRVDEVLEHVQELPGGVDQVGRDLVEQVEVRLFSRKDAQLQVSSHLLGSTQRVHGRDYPKRPVT
jgi:hypothetical protein